LEAVSNVKGQKQLTNADLSKYSQRLTVETSKSNRQTQHLFWRPDQCSRSSYVYDKSCLLVSSLPSLFYTMTSHRDIYICEMLRNDYTVPTRCRHRGGMIDPLGCKACRAIRQPISPSNQIQDHSIQNIPKPVSFLSSGVSSESDLTPLNPTISHT
jgi:hypothetical protein